MSRNLSNPICSRLQIPYSININNGWNTQPPQLFSLLFCVSPFLSALKRPLRNCRPAACWVLGQLSLFCLCKLARAGASNLAEHSFQNAPTLLNYLRKNHHLGRFLKRGFSGCKQLLPKTPQGHQSIVLNLPAFRRMPWALSLESECECDWKPCVFL